MPPSGKRVLIAEDNVVLGDVVRFNLERSGFEVTLARTGDDALHQVSSQTFDILVTDYEMPGVNGAELCRVIREELKQEDLRILMCSAKGLELNRDELSDRYGLEAILFKPFSIRELTGLLNKMESRTTSRPPNLSPSN